MRTTRPVLATFAVLATAALAACSVSSGDDGGARGGAATTKVVLATHDSWAMPASLVTAFEKDTGLDLVVVPSGDAGQLTNKLVLTKDAPIADVVYGIDNTFASRALDAGVLENDAASDPPATARDYALPGDARHGLAPVDWADVCVNVDDAWFRKDGRPEPRTLDDLTKPAYRDLFVIPGATTSSPGLAFLLATIAAYGEDGWQDYWSRLMANGAMLTQGWSDAYEVDFTQGGGGGDRPIVVSYDSSPAFTVDGQGGTTTSALLDTCFRQVEYAGVLAGANNPEGAQALVDFMLSRPFQEALPEAMYVFPVDAGAPLPEDWASFAEQPERPYTVDPAAIAEHRDEWLRDWSDVTSR
jgi:thiamine transport system substrate-binding protein